MEKLTVEDRIMGRTEPLPKTDLQLKAFTAETKYKVNSIGKDNPSIIVGSFVDRILPIKIKQQIKKSGQETVRLNYFVIFTFRITRPCRSSVYIFYRFRTGRDRFCLSSFPF